MHTLSLLDFSMGTGGKCILNRFRKGIHLICLTPLPRPKPHNIFGWSFKGIFLFCPPPPTYISAMPERNHFRGDTITATNNSFNMDVSFVFRGVQNFSALGPSTQVVDLWAAQLKNDFPFSDRFLKAWRGTTNFRQEREQIIDKNRKSKHHFVWGDFAFFLSCSSNDLATP